MDRVSHDCFMQCGLLFYFNMANKCISFAKDGAVYLRHCLPGRREQVLLHMGKHTLVSILQSHRPSSANKTVAEIMQIAKGSMQL